MRTNYTPHRLRSLPLVMVLFATILFVGCSGYQSVSYYGDGIYGDMPNPQPRNEVVASPQSTQPAQQSGSYYKNYFADKASQGIQDDYIFTDPEQYQNPAPEQTSAGNYQAHGSWGDQVDNVNVNIIYNRPIGWGWGWYDAPYNYGRTAFWGYNYHPWYFTFNQFHNPYYNPYRWGYHNPYYNPYRWGYRNPYNPYWNRWNNYNPYHNSYGNRNYNRRNYREPVIYNRLNGGRGDSRISRSSSRNSNVQGRDGERVQTNTRSGSLRNKMRRSRSDNSYSTPSTQNQRQNTSSRRSTNTNSNSRSRNNMVH